MLPADADGIHLIIAGHRRHTAAQKAGGVDCIPVIIRAMNPIEVIEAMLSENENRAALLPSDQIRASDKLCSSVSADDPEMVCSKVMMSMIGNHRVEDDTALIVLRRTQ